MRSSFLPFALPDTDATELEQIKQCLEFGWITTGPKTREFERQFAKAVGAKHAIAVNSCTAAMHLSLEAIGLKSGDEVITSPYTFAATTEVIRYFDATPVLVDINPGCLNISPQAIEAAITPRTKAIMPIHIAGLPAQMNAIRDIAMRHNLAVVEDAAHAFPCAYQGRQIGSPIFPDGTNIPHFTCFSFYATKTITTGEGGMICTDDDELADRCRIMALHGISRDAWKRYTAEGTWYYEIVAPGYKYNLTDIAASIGVAQLAKSDRMWERRKAIAQQYNRAFAQYPSLQIPIDRSDCTHAWHLYILRLNLDWFEIDRAQFMDELKRRNIGASVHFIPLHLHPYYRDKYGYEPTDFPVSYGQFLRTISLPMYSKMSDRDVEDVIAAVLDIVNLFATNTPNLNSDEKTARSSCSCTGATCTVSVTPQLVPCSQAL
jgi:dTDP-4-amino-4,6-dideoxygalactose transaminase